MSTTWNQIEAALPRGFQPNALDQALEEEVRAAAKGDSDAFGRIVSASSRMVCSIALAIVRDLHASEDVAQEVYAMAWRDVGKLRNPQSFLPWLRQMTRNRAHSYLRDQVSRHAPLSDEAAEGHPDPRAGAEVRLIRKEEMRLLDEVIDSLPDDAREVVTLYYREGESIRQVAALLGLREDAVRQRLSRARALIREEVLRKSGRVLAKTATGAAFTTVVLAALTTT
ncbi:MAG: sigma-70 family RNA polymerase sigma factor, partial [Thermoanaerobaculia bacterium]